jgi:hypothetical protein
MEPSLGGELYVLLKARGSFSERCARFYAAQVVSMFECLHR